MTNPEEITNTNLNW